MLRCTIQELKKNFYLPYILVPVLGTLCLCLTALGDIGGMGERIPVFSLMLNHSVAESEEQITKSVLYLWKEGLGNWLQLFAPLLLTSGYIAQLSDERQSGQVQFQLFWSGNFRYCASKIISGALTGGILLTAGYALYGILLSFFSRHFQVFLLTSRVIIWNFILVILFICIRSGGWPGYFCMGCMSVCTA